MGCHIFEDKAALIHVYVDMSVITETQIADMSLRYIHGERHLGNDRIMAVLTCETWVVFVWPGVKVWCGVNVCGGHPGSGFYLSIYGLDDICGYLVGYNVSLLGSMHISRRAYSTHGWRGTDVLGELGYKNINNVAK